MKKIIHHICFGLCISAALVACSDKEKALVRPNLTQQGVQATDMQITTTKDNAAADGVQANEVLLQVRGTLKANSREVSFELPAGGKFTNGSSSQTVLIDVNGEARAGVVSDATGLLTVKAKVGEFSRQTAVQFGIAWPESILVSVDSLELGFHPRGYSKVTATLVRPSGRVSPGVAVQFTDSTAGTGRSVGFFANTTFAGADARANADYWVQDSTFKGDVFLIATVVNGTAVLARGRSRIRIR